MFTIQNSANGITQIDILGDIGENWWTGEGHTLDSVRSQLSEISGDIKVNIASLGGSLIDGLAIYDLLKAYNGKVTTNIIGATASAGTIVAMGGDEVLISENSLFLSHKASMGVWGNAEDLRAAADDLDMFDSRIVNIYKKKTKKKDEDIKNLMNEDKWITAEEALNFGFVDSIYKPSKVLNSADLSKLSNIKPLPTNFNNKMENNETIVNAVLAKLGLQKISNEVSLDTLKAENEQLKAEIANLKKVDNSAKVGQLTNEIETLNQTITNKVNEFDALKTQFDALTVANQENLDKIAQLEGKPKNDGGSDPNIDGKQEDTPLNEYAFMDKEGFAAKYFASAKFKQTAKIN